MDIVVKKDFTEADAKQADLKRSEFRKSQATSNVSNLLGAADAGATVLLCEDHVAKFAKPEVLSKYGYRKADAVPTALGLYPFVLSRCDYCQADTRCTMFIHESIYAQAWMTTEQRKRDHEYAAICRG